MTKRQPGGQFVDTPLSGRVFTNVQDEQGEPRAAFRDAAPVVSMGEANIRNAETLRRNSPERKFEGAPKFWRVTNRAELGNVKVWCGAFDGEIYPEGANGDKRTWLQPGEHLLMPMQAGLHFFGNVFDDSLPDARDVIERCGGFELEGSKKTEMRGAPRIIGGPIGLPDFIIEHIDARGRRFGETIAIYEAYDRVTRKLWRTRSSNDPDLLAEEKAILAQRIAEYTLDDAILYEADGKPVRVKEAAAT